MNQLVSVSTAEDLDAGWPQLDPIHVEPLAARVDLHNRSASLNRYRDLQQLTWISRGGGRCELDGRYVALKAPVLVATPPGIAPQVDFDAGAEGLVVLAVGSAQSQMLSPEDAAALAGPLVVSPPEGAAGPMAAAFGFLHGEFGRRGAGRRSGLVAGYLRVVSLVARAADESASAEDRCSPDAALVARFRELIEARYREHAPLEAYGEALNVSQAKLSRACRRVAGKAPLALVHERLLLEARRQLTFGAMSVSQIARSLGFSDAAYFSRFFQKRMGMAPSAFREGERR